MIILGRFGRAKIQSQENCLSDNHRLIHEGWVGDFCNEVRNSDFRSALPTAIINPFRFVGRDFLFEISRQWSNDATIE